MTDETFPSTTQALQLPELLAPIGSYLDPPDLLQCVQVSQHWYQTLIPFLWRTIDDRLYSWRRIFKDLPFLTLAEQVEKENWINHVFVKYGRHIRTFRATGFTIVVLAQSAGTCVNLRTMAVTGDQSPYFFQEARMVQILLRGCKTVEEAHECLLNALISPAFKDQINLPFLISPSERWYQAWIFIQRFWLLVLQNPLLEGVRLGKDLPLGHLAYDRQFILKALASLPHLTRLDTYHYDSWFTFKAVLEHLPKVQHFASCAKFLTFSDLDRTFRQIRSLRCSVVLQLQQLFVFFDCLPNLDQLWIKGFLKPAPVESNEPMENTSSLSTTSRLRELHFTHEQLRLAEDMDEPLAELVLRRLPCLKTLALRALYPRTATALGTHCPELERFHLIDHGLSLHPRDGNLLVVNVVGDLLRRCPNIKVLDVIGHAVEAEYLLAEPWVCQGLETFRCQIIGMNRLTIKEQDIYKSRASAVGRDKQDKGKSMDEEDAANAMEVVEKRRRCHELHGRVYDRLAEMSRLKVLDLGSDFWDPYEVFGGPNVFEVDGRVYSTFSPPIPNTLELSLESGVSRLGVLKNLAVFGFEGVDHRIGTKELSWMAESWPRLRIMRGLQPQPFRTLCDDPGTRSLKEFMEELRPLVRHEAIMEDHTFSVRNESLWSAL